MDTEFYRAKVIYIHAGTIFDVVLTLPGYITLKIKISICELNSRDFTVPQKKRMKEIAMALLLGHHVIVYLEGEKDGEVYPAAVFFDNKSLESRYAKDGESKINFGLFLKELSKENEGMPVSGDVLMSP